MTEQQLTIAVIGAGGKMGMRVSDNLQRSAHHVRYAENSPAGRQRTTDAGRTVTDSCAVLPLSSEQRSDTTRVAGPGSGSTRVYCSSGESFNISDGGTLCQ